jgi:hypothetical protein
LDDLNHNAGANKELRRPGAAEGGGHRQIGTLKPLRNRLGRRLSSLRRVRAIRVFDQRDYSVLCIFKKLRVVAQFIDGAWSLFQPTCR